MIWFNAASGYIAAAALAAGALAGWTVRDWKADAALAKVQAKAEKVRAEMQGRIDAQATEFEQFRTGLEPARQETRNTIREIYRNVQIPDDCAAPAAAVGVLQSARNRANAAATGQLGLDLSAAAARP